MAAMTASLEWLLAQHDLGLRLVAGVPAREQLTWAHASALVDPTPWLTGGALLLTTGNGLPRLAGVVSVLSKELRCEAVVLDEYAAVMASSGRQGGLLELVRSRWDEFVPDARRGLVGVTTEHGILEIQTLRGRAAVVGWLAVQRTTPLSPTDRLLLNPAVSLITLQLDWPAELIAAYHSLGGTLLDLLLDPAQDAATLVRHLRHFGFEAGSAVKLAVITAPRGHKRLLGIVSGTLERASRPH